MDSFLRQERAQGFAEERKLMKCPNCGGDLTLGKLYCENCGHEVQMVPDYDPLDELLIGREENIRVDRPSGQETSVQRGSRKPENRTEKAGKTESSEKKPEEKKAETAKEKTKEKNGAFCWRKWSSWKLWQKCVLIAGCILLCAGAAFGSYSLMTRGNDYSYQLRHGKNLVKKEKYEEAIPYLEKAQELQADMGGADTEPLRCLAYAYAGADRKKSAVECMKDAVTVEEKTRGADGELLDIYIEFMEILNLTGQTEQTEEIIKKCPYKEIRNSLKPYLIRKPSCDVPEGMYGYYLRLELEADYGKIYYTLDGTEPTEESARFESPIEIREEGEVLLTAVAINDKGMVSEPLVLVYKLDFSDASEYETEE